MSSSHTHRVELSPIESSRIQSDRSRTREDHSLFYSQLLSHSLFEFILYLLIVTKTEKSASFHTNLSYLLIENNPHKDNMMKYVLLRIISYKHQITCSSQGFLQLGQLDSKTLFGCCAA